MKITVVQPSYFAGEAPNGNILADIGKGVGSVSAEVDLSYKYKRPAGFGEAFIGNDDFINEGLRPHIFKK